MMLLPSNGGMSHRLCRFEFYTNQIQSDESPRNKVCHLSSLYRRGDDKLSMTKEAGIEQIQSYSLQITIYNENQFQSKRIYCNGRTAIERSSSMMEGKKDKQYSTRNRQGASHSKSNCSNQFSNYNFFYFLIYTEV